MNKYIKFLIAGLMIAGSLPDDEPSNRMGNCSRILFAESYFIIFQNEYILLAFWQMRKQNFVKAAHWLTYIKTTNLSCTNLNMVISIIYKVNFSARTSRKSRTIDEKALEYGLNMKHDRAMATLNIAAAALSKGRKAEAQNY